MAKYLDAKGVQYLVALLKQYISSQVPNFNDIYSKSVQFGPSSSNMATDGKYADSIVGSGNRFYTKITRTDNVDLTANVTIPEAGSTTYGVISMNTVKSIIDEVIANYNPPKYNYTTTHSLTISLTGYEYWSGNNMDVKLGYGTNTVTVQAVRSGSSSKAFVISSDKLNNAFASLAVPDENYGNVSIAISSPNAAYSMTADTSDDAVLYLTKLNSNDQTVNWTYSPNGFTATKPVVIRIYKGACQLSGNITLNFSGNGKTSSLTYTLSGTSTKNGSTSYNSESAGYFTIEASTSDMTNVAKALGYTAATGGNISYSISLATANQGCMRCGGTATASAPIASTASMTFASSALTGTTNIEHYWYNSRVWVSSAPATFEAAGGSKTLTISHAYATYSLSGIPSPWSISSTTGGNMSTTASTNFTVSVTQNTSTSSGRTATVNINVTPSDARVTSTVSLSQDKQEKPEQIFEAWWGKGENDSTVKPGGCRPTLTSNSTIYETTDYLYVFTTYTDKTPAFIVNRKSSNYIQSTVAYPYISVNGSIDDQVITYSSASFDADKFFSEPVLLTHMSLVLKREGASAVTGGAPLGEFTLISKQEGVNYKNATGTLYKIKYQVSISPRLNSGYDGYIDTNYGSSVISLGFVPDQEDPTNTNKTTTAYESITFSGSYA